MDDQDITLAEVYLRSVIRKLVSGQFQHYTGVPTDWVSSTVARTSLDNVRPEVFYRSNTSVLLAAVLKKIYVKIIRGNFSNSFVVDGVPIADGKVDERDVLDEDD